MAYGIDSQIQDRVDAYRGNPQQLMQRYQQNQQLLDLLALQKLKSEKDAAARDMQMKMQQQPGTIKQQREQELLGRTKDELMQQTQGVMQQRQAQQQQNLQRIAQGGLGGLAQTRPVPGAQSMPKMASGGIVAFQEGGLSEMGGLQGVTQEEIDAYRRSQRGQASRGVRNLTDSQIAQIISEQRSGLGGLPMSAGERRIALRTGTLPDLSDIGRPAGLPADYEPGTMAELGPEGAPSKPIPMPDTPLQRGPATRAKDITGAGSQYEPLPMGPQNGRTSGIAAVDKETAEATATEPAAPKEGIAGLGGGAGGALGAMQQGFNIADQYLGREEKAGRYAELEAELRAMDEERSDPRRRRNRRLTEFLIGAGGYTSAGGALAGGARASLNYLDREEARDRERLKEIISLAERGMGLDSEIASRGMQLGQAMYQEYMATKRAAMNNAAAMTRDEAARMAQRVRDAQAQANTDRQYQLDVAKHKEQAQQALRDDMRLTGTQAMDMVNNVQSMHTTLRDSWLAANPEYQQLQLQLMTLKGADLQAASNRVTQLVQQADEESWGALDRPLEGSAPGTPTPLDLYEQALVIARNFSQGVTGHTYSE